MVAPPEDPEGETERTFDFIRQVKKVNPDAEIIVYIYTPLPAEQRARCRAPGARAAARRCTATRSTFRRTPEEWTERRWVDYACHADAPWMSDRLRRRVQRFRHRVALPVSDGAGHAFARAGRRRRCAGSRAGAIRCAATTGPGSCAPRRISSACSIRAPRASDAARHATRCSSASSPTRGGALREQLLVDWHSLVDVAESAAAAGVRTSP